MVTRTKSRKKKISNWISRISSVYIQEKGQTIIENVIDPKKDRED